MKRFTRISAIFISAVVLIAGCKSGDENGQESGTTVTVATGSIKNITSTSAVVGFEVTGTYTEAGICYAETENPTVNSSKAPAPEGASECALADLPHDTKIYVRAYAIQSGGDVVYGAEKNFSTLARDVPAVSEVTIANILFISAEAAATVTAGAEVSITERGFCYGTAEGVSVEDAKVTVAGTTGEMKATLAELDAETVYYIKAYVVHDGKTAYGAETSFETASTLTMEKLHRISAHQMYADINVTSTGVAGKNWDELGVCWNTTGNPTVADNVKTVANPEKKEYDLRIANLNPETNYYVRAYLKSGDDIYYAAEEMQEATLEPFFSENVMFNNNMYDIPNKYWNGWGYSKTIPEDQEDEGTVYVVRSKLMEDYFDALYDAIYKLGGRTLSNVEFMFNWDSEGNEIFSFRIQYKNSEGTSTFTAYYDFLVDVDENGFITVSAPKWDHTNNNPMTIYTGLKNNGDAGALHAYFDYLLQGEFYLDHYVIEYWGEDMNYGYMLASTKAQDGDYFALRFYKRSRKNSETSTVVPAPWTEGMYP